MSDKIKNVALGLLATLLLGVSSVSLNMWADWREWKAYKAAMNESRMAKLEMQVQSDKELFNSRIDALNTRFGEMSARECK